MMPLTLASVPHCDGERKHESSIPPEIVCEDEERSFGFRKQPREFAMTKTLLPGELIVHRSLRTCGSDYAYFLADSLK